MPEHLARNKYKKNNGEKTPKFKTTTKKPQPNSNKTKQNNKTKHNGLLSVDYHIMNTNVQKYATETMWETCSKGSLSIFTDNEQVTYMFISLE